MLDVGNIMATQGIMQLIEENKSFAKGVAYALKRHMTCDWGEVCQEDKEANDLALANGERILSAYTIDGVKIWIITEWDRSYTTVLLPEEY